MKAIYVSTKENTPPKVIEVEDSLSAFYDLIGCSTIDITSRMIKDTFYDIICDDEGLLINNPKVSAIYENNAPALVGNLIILGSSNGVNCLQGLTNGDIAKIMRNIKTGYVSCNKGYKLRYFLEITDGDTN